MIGINGYGHKQFYCILLFKYVLKFVPFICPQKKKIRHFNLYVINLKMENCNCYVSELGLSLQAI